MAYMEGNALSNTGDMDKKRLAILVLSCILVSVLAVYYSKSRSVNFSIIAFTIVSCLMFAFVYFKLNPKAWLRLFSKREYERLLEQDGSIISVLSELDDSYFILTNIIVEFFYIEYLIVSVRGIFVVGIVNRIDAAGFKERLAGAAAYSLEEKMSSLWRICHFLNILIKKSFGADIMPQPVIFLPEAVPAPLEKPEGMIITARHELKTILKTLQATPLPAGLPESLAYFIKTRYVKQ